ncbi:hypothetical protein PR048_021744 [Dryococelus australis]|uniref:Uncharacterized protein n=1 Tax=Dryococelus australis TaxID=614101 RepID=A0ABQ9GZ27_9NEOP|nr:hypothetical protein PR048_021744 [Dryococelus australis]
MSPPLPPSRVNDASVFEVFGIDYASALIMRVYRAVHWEIVTTLITDSFPVASDEQNTILLECESLVDALPITITLETYHDPLALKLAAFPRTSNTVARWKLVKLRVLQLRTSIETMIRPLQRVFTLEVDTGPAEFGVDETDDDKGGVA